MLVSAFIGTIYLPSRIDLALQYRQKLFSVAGKFSEFLGRPASLSDLTVQNICNYLTFYRKGWSARATNNQRKILLSIWQDASDRTEILPLLSAMPNRKKIRKLPEELDPPEAWDLRQVGDLFDECRALRGFVGDVPACHWWLSLFDAIYWTSNRISAMLAVPSACYDGAGVLVRKQKNKRPQWFPLPESCRELIELTRPGDRKLIWAHPWHPRTVWAHARKIIESAGLPAPKTGRQLFHRLRRTTITLCASVDPAVAQRTAGHKDYATTERSYVDPRLLRARSAVDVLPDPLAANRSPWPEKPLYETKTPKFRIYG